MVPKTILPQEDELSEKSYYDNELNNDIDLNAFANESLTDLLNSTKFSSESVKNQFSYNNKQLNLVSKLDEKNYIDDAALDNIVDDDNSIFEILSFVDLLKYLSIKKESEIYYYLMNNVEVLTFEFGKIEIKSNDPLKKINIELENFLLEATKSPWRVIASNSKIINCFKDNLKNNAAKTELWQKIVEYFPHAQINDILLNS